MMDWRQFIVAYGSRSPVYELAAVVGQPPKVITRLRNTTPCTAHRPPKRFAELYALYHGRAPEDHDWPVPVKVGSGGYCWLTPELALVGELAGRMDVPTIATLLTDRLRQITGDECAARSPMSVQNAIQRIGLQTSDVLGGVTVAQAGREIESRATVYHAIREQRLPTFSIGRLLVIPHEAWRAFKANRQPPPPDYIPLASIKKQLGCSHDKTAEYAKLGYIPTAVRCHAAGTGRSTQYGTWYIDATVARALIADRRAGRPLPWHGKRYRTTCARPTRCGGNANIRPRAKPARIYGGSRAHRAASRNTGAGIRHWLTAQNAI